MCDILQQIRAISEREGITITALERSIGASKGVLSRALTNGTDIQSKWVRKIVENYPQYSAEWIITGRGDALKGSQTPVNPHQQTAAEPESPVQYMSKNLDACPINRAKSGATRPRIPFTAAAGALSVAIDAASEGDCDQVPIVATLPAYDFTIIIEGDSMAPEYRSGDELACRMIDDVKDIQWGKPYILDTRDGVVFKSLYYGDGEILCHSINPAGPSFAVADGDVLHVASVVGLIRQLQP